MSDQNNSQDHPARRLPVRPNLDQLRHQAKDLLRAIRRGEPEAIEEFNAFHPMPIPVEAEGRVIAEEASVARPAAGETPAVPVETTAVSRKVKLADAQLALARSYESQNWVRLVQSCKLIDAIWRDDVDVVRELVVKHPKLLHENAGIRNNNWGPPLSYAANLGRDAIIRMLYEHGARDLEHAIGRATLQGKIETAGMLYAMLGAPAIPR